MRATMRLKSNLCAGAATLVLAVMLAAIPARLHAQQSPDGIRVGDTDLGLQAIRAAGMDAVDVRPLRRANT